MYDGDFSSWADVQSNFATDEKEPTKVYYAGYFYADYEGSACVIYRRGRDNYYIVEGGHCSCNGLEGQWEPEHYKGKKLFKDVLSKRNTYGLTKEAIEQLFKMLEE